MRKLLRQIKRELKTAKHCAIYEEELNRVWPNDGNQREPKIARFAEDNGFRLRFYSDVPCLSANPFPGSAASSFVKDRLALPRPENAERLVTIERVKPNTGTPAASFTYVRTFSREN
jgi:hypothetical protein